APNQGAAVYVGGTLVTTTTVTVDGLVSVLIPRPAGNLDHAVTVAAANGQTASAPLIVVPSQGTPTSTSTATSTATPPITATSTSTPTSTPCTITFTDVHPADYFYNGVRWLYCRGAISGYNDNTFRPYNNTTRGQMVKII